MRLTSTGHQASKEELQSITSDDVPLDQVGLNSQELRIDDARWAADCQSCERQNRVKAEMLGRKVKCKACENVFIIEWPPLVEHSIEGINSEVNPTTQSY
jgi:hypothetical protein